MPAARRSIASTIPLVVIAAVLLAGSLVPTGRASMAGTAAFTDIGESRFRSDTFKHHDRTNRLAESRITAGCGTRMFCPTGTVTRGQMASGLSRALGPPATPRSYSRVDDASIHHDAIMRIAAAGIASGCDTGRFCAGGPVTREQTAAILRRVLAARVTPPASSPAPPPCLTTLQALVDRAAAGATITAPGCRFRETVTITKPITLIGSGAMVDGGGVREHGFVVKADDVTIDGFEITGTTNPAQTGAVQVRGVDRFTLRNADIHHAGGACVSIKDGSGHRILSSRLAYCDQEGFHLSHVRDTRVANNRIHHNNPDEAYSSAWEAGAGKAARSERLVFEGNEVYANRGPGIWCDLDCRDVTIRHNRVHHNEKAGIYFEISDGAVIHDNVAWENGWKKMSWGWGGGIVIASSRNVEVRNNVVAWNADGISIISQDRTTDSSYMPGSSTWGVVDNVYVHHNDIFLAPQPSDRSGKFLLAWLQDWDGVMLDPESNNRGSANRYWRARSEPAAQFAWGSEWRRLADFMATLGESGGRYLRSSERAAILSESGVPAAPEPR